MDRKAIDSTIRTQCMEAGIPFVGYLMSAYSDRFDIDLGGSDSDERFTAKAHLLADNELFKSLVATAKDRLERDLAKRR